MWCYSGITTGLMLPRVVVDTNVVFEGLTKQGGASGLIVDAWLAGLIAVCVSNALAYEYDDVLSRKLSKERWSRLQPVLGIGLLCAVGVVLQTNGIANLVKQLFRPRFRLHRAAYQQKW